MISSCLTGSLVRYDGRRVPLDDEWVSGLLKSGICRAVCPEVDAGMSIPRPPAQILGGDGYDVLSGRARVMDEKGRDVTSFFVRGAELSLSIVKKAGIQIALMKEKSPSCGSRRVYDGSFSSRLIDGVGVTTAILRENGVLVFSENEILNFKTFVKQNLF